MKFVKNELFNESSNIFENYDLKRQEGENDSFIYLFNDTKRFNWCIQFIVAYNCYSLSRQITPSIFETNSFLIERKNTTLIEYSAFFGSIQIFKYLMMNEVELTESLWLYAVHSKNAELIQMQSWFKFLMKNSIT